ncbi:MAG: DUF4177 domain-containing protein [Ferruginibacter sp.]|nr:DUF4177 domain-containing protein [Ferruginibacter sp.]
MKKFEYKTLPIPTTGWMKYKQDFEALTVQLNELGKQGWEVTVTLTNMYSSGNNTPNIILLKREISH